MRTVDEYSHHNAIEYLAADISEFNQVKEAINSCSLKFGVHRPSQIKSEISKYLNNMGWADRVRILPSSNLTISFMKSKIGLCLQLGNVARTYADILKLDFLGNEDIIEVGIIIVPGTPESRMLGANYAHFDRLSREIEIFSGIIDTPLLILSISN